MYASWYPGILARRPSLLFTPLLLGGLVTALVGRYPAGPPPTARAPAIKLDFQELPLSFVPNAGQAAPSIRFQVQDRGNRIFFTDREVVLGLSGTGRSTPLVVGLRFEGANPKPVVTGLEHLPGIANYFIGNDPMKWRTNLPTYADIVYRQLYPGIDLRYDGTSTKLKGTYTIAPGAKPGLIRWRHEGARDVRVDETTGNLLISLSDIPRGSHCLVEHAPIAWQDIDGRRIPVTARYTLAEDGSAGFALGGYDPARPLVIDPTLSFSTYFGGSRFEESEGIAIDSVGNIYITGTTDSNDLPTKDPLQGSRTGSEDLFVAKINAAGNALIYSTYLGGSDDDEGLGIAIDGAGNAYLTGVTTSTNFPTINAARDRCTSFLGVCTDDAFLTKLNENGNVLLYSTYLGGSFPDEAEDIAVDNTGNAYMVGSTNSLDFPTKDPLQSTLMGPSDAFVAKIDTTKGGAASLIYSTYLGGSTIETGDGIALDGAGNAYVTGQTLSSDFPTQNPMQATNRGFGDVFVTKLNPSGSALIYSTYLGGSYKDYSYDIAVDTSGNALVTGNTESTDFSTQSPLQASSGGFSDAFVAELDAGGSTLLYSTYLGGNGNDYGYGIAVDSAGSAYVTGNTSSPDFPTQESLQAYGGGGDAFVTKVNVNGSALLYSSYLGGSQADFGSAIAVDLSGNAYVLGETHSTNFPTANALQPSFGGGELDAFVAKIGANGSSAALNNEVTLFVPIVLAASGLSNSFFTSELCITNRGASDVTLEYVYTPVFGGGGGRALSTLPAGRQQIVPDAIAYLRSIGIPLPDSGNRGGTLVVRFSGLSSSSDGAVTVRTMTTVAEGHAGLAYKGISAPTALTGPSYLCGLRQNATDRSNVALQNVGTEAQGDITLRLTVFSGDPARQFQRTLPDERLSPGGFRQINEILSSNGMGLSNGYLQVERVSGSAPYYAYAVINDQATSDGSFIPPSLVTGAPQPYGLTLPVIVETNSFASELVLTNTSAEPKTLRFTYVADAIQNENKTANFAVDLKSFEQSIIPNLVQWLRDQGIPGIGPVGTVHVGPLFVTGATGENPVTGIFLGARTSTQGRGGHYGVFYPAVPDHSFASGSIWIDGLQQNANNRTNLALVNIGDRDENSSDVFRIELFDGETGVKVSTVEGVTVKPRSWRQLGSILANFAPGTNHGYARVTRTAGLDSFIAYAIVNDGGQPGEGTGDGAFVSSSL